MSKQPKTPRITPAFCPAEFFGFDSKNCICPKHWPAFLARPEVQRGLKQALARKACDGMADWDAGTSTDCPNTEGLRPYLPGASADDGTEVFFMLCPACRKHA